MQLVVDEFVRKTNTTAKRMRAVSVIAGVLLAAVAAVAAVSVRHSVVPVLVPSRLEGGGA